jgi:hypothetical protein
MPDVWGWLTGILLFAVIAVIYIARRPASQRKLFSILAIELVLGLILEWILAALPLNTLYVLTLASTPLLAIGFLVLNALGKRIRAAIQAQDRAQENALSIRFVLASALVLLPMLFIFTLVQRLPNIQRTASLVIAVLFPLMLLVAGFRGAIISLRQPTRWYSLQFALSVISIASSILFAYLFAHNVFHVL